jgi:hypothetical protein
MDDIKKELFIIDINIIVVKIRETNNMCRIYRIKYYIEVQKLERKLITTLTTPD